MLLYFHGLAMLLKKEKDKCILIRLLDWPYKYYIWFPRIISLIHMFLILLALKYFTSSYKLNVKIFLCDCIKMSKCWHLLIMYIYIYIYIYE